MTSAYAAKLGSKARHTTIEAQKIDDFTLKMFKIVLASFQVEDKIGKAWFFQKTFLLANISVEAILGILFLTFSNVNVQFVEKKLI